MATVVNLSFKVDVSGSTSNLANTIVDLEKSISLDDNTQSVLRAVYLAANASTLLFSEAVGDDIAGFVFQYGVILSSHAVVVGFHGEALEADNSAFTLPAGMPFIFPGGKTTAYNSSGSARAELVEANSVLGLRIRNDSGSTAVIQAFFVGVE